MEQPFYGENVKTTSTPSRTPNLSNSWEFAGWGATYYIDLPIIESEDGHPQTKSLLGQWRATSISGNDLVASVLYTIGLCIVVAGKFAPISLFIVAIIIYPFKDILSEVGTALPLNGGSYNCLLNTSSKWFASVAAAVSLLDYMSTAVVSAATATSYISGSLHLSNFLVFVLTIGILIVSASIVASGLKESSNVAFVIFIIHCLTLTLLMIASVVRWIIQGNDILIENWKNPGSGNPLLEIFNGICVGLLGITGFETSSNYIEDQKPGVFPKTVRNMWVLVFIFNAPISFLALTIIPLSTIKEHQNEAISTIGKYAAGNWLEILIVIDAAIVLSGGVLSGFVGATGLIQRMASDHILPQFLLRKNRFTGTCHWIVLSFLTFCITLYVIVGGNTTSLAGVFAISFLSVLCMFAIGNILLKYKRGRLYRKIIILHKSKIANTVISLIKKLKKQPVIFFTNTDELHILNKEPNSDNYGIVSEYAGKNLRQYIATSVASINKLEILIDISLTLNKLHSSGLIHKNIHTKNILRKQNSTFIISDFGLCFQANKELDCKEYFGVIKLPNITPDFLLAKEICYSDIRPEISLELPTQIVSLIKRCWDNIPNNRPKSHEIYELLSEWWMKLLNMNDLSLNKLFESSPILNIIDNSNIILSHKFKSKRLDYYHYLDKIIDQDYMAVDEFEEDHPPSFMILEGIEF
ncbi:9368_t:CDS:2 [Diversispora eburnea]|uniref:9368_t:CDS:1 n=1 Tax=Diversispora eburnea TaxID=1213867 RepID=A0A9N8YP05_9GLOM|nr:9368_t:CDS:2 [Diversispora eburnea]